MRAQQLADLLAQLVPLKEPVLISGTPGLGKTDIVSQAAAACNMKLIVTHPVVDDPTDYKGMPGIVKGADGPSAEFLPFGNLREMIEAKEPTVVFADDLGQAPMAVQAAFMQLLLARTINGKSLSPEVRFIAATNRRQDKAGVGGLITPLLDRFTTHVTLEYHNEDFRGWCLDPKNKMPAVIPAFAAFRSDMINDFEATRDMRKCSTPRSVAGVGRLVNAGLGSNYEVISGAAGEKFGTEFVAFFRVWTELPDRERIYKDPDSVAAPKEDKPDILYALMGSLASGADAKNMKNVVKFLTRCPAEYTVLCMRDIIRRNRELKETKAFIDWAVKNAKLLGTE